MGTILHRLAPASSLFSMCRVCVATIGSVGLFLVAQVSAAPAPAGDPAAAAATAATAYRQATDSFNKEDYGHALELLEPIPEAGKPGEQADVWNLRGAIYLHQHRYAKARTAFAKAAEKDPGLWAARYNLAEVSFREGKYGQSSKEFEQLFGQTNRWTRSDERGFLQYKLLLTQLLAGKEKPAETYIDEHRGDRSPTLMYYYLNAVLEHRRGHGRQAEQWLAQADARYSPANEQIFAESFRALGWNTERSERLIAAARRHDASSTTPTPVAVLELMPGQTPAARPDDPASTAAAALAAANAARPAFRTTAPPAPSTSLGDADVAQMPPSEQSALPEPAGAEPSGAPGPDDLLGESRAVYSRPIVLGRPAASPAKAKSTPAASPSASAASPTDSPAAATAAATPGASASSSPTVPPKREYLEKYEQAYVKFVEKNFPAARTLLDEADAIQAGQATSTTLRGQIFKHYYEAAYMAYKQRSDYAGALTQLDEADATQPNQPDALNLRGLTYSKQKEYDHAEAAFKRAIQADPQFWAARFNYAELPFNYRNYTSARARFEELSAQTDSARQPREAELTQFKIFLTLLLEGKVDGARSFMGHLSFTGTTPARYFCQAALEFYAGSADKAQSELDSANKEFQPRLVDIFKESFYRIGWLNDPSNPAGAPPPTAASALAEASPSPAADAAAAPGLPTLAVASPSVPPAATPMAPAASPAVVALSTPQPAPASAPAGTPAADLTGPTPAATAADALAQATDTPAPSDQTVDALPSKPTSRENLVRLLFISLFLVNTAYCVIKVLMAILNHSPNRVAPVQRSPLYAERDEVNAEPVDEVKAPR